MSDVRLRRGSLHVQQGGENGKEVVASEPEDVTPAQRPFRQGYATIGEALAYIAYTAVFISLYKILSGKISWKYVTLAKILYAGMLARLAFSVPRGVQTLLYDMRHSKNMKFISLLAIVLDFVALCLRVWVIWIFATSMDTIAGLSSNQTPTMLFYQWLELARAPIDKLGSVANVTSTAAKIYDDISKDIHIVVVDHDSKSLISTLIVLWACFELLHIVVEMRRIAYSGIPKEIKGNQQQDIYCMQRYVVPIINLGKFTGVLIATKIASDQANLLRARFITLSPGLFFIMELIIRLRWWILFTLIYDFLKNQFVATGATNSYMDSASAAKLHNNDCSRDCFVVWGVVAVFLGWVLLLMLAIFMFSTFGGCASPLWCENDTGYFNRDWNFYLGKFLVYWSLNIQVAVPMLYVLTAGMSMYIYFLESALTKVRD